MTLWHTHEWIYRRDDTGKMGVCCLHCLKQLPLPWATERVPVPSVAELERLIHK